MCAEEDRYIQFMAARAQPPPLTSGDTLHWDGRGAIAQDVALTQGAELGACTVLPVHGQLATGCQALPCVPTRPLSPHLSLLVPTIEWAKAAASLAFYLDPKLLLPPRPYRAPQRDRHPAVGPRAGG